MGDNPISGATPKQLRAIEDWQEKKIKETYIKVSSDYKDCNFTNNWVNKEN